MSRCVCFADRRKDLVLTEKVMKNLKYLLFCTYQVFSDTIYRVKVWGEP